MDSKLEQLFYVALGSALAVKEKIEKNSEEMKAWQAKAEQNARGLFDELAERGAEEKDAMKKIFRDALREVVAELDLVTRADLEELKKELGK